MKFKIEEQQSCEQKIKGSHCLIRMVLLERVLIFFSWLNLIYLNSAPIRADAHADFPQNANAEISESVITCLIVDLYYPTSPKVCLVKTDPKVANVDLLQPPPKQGERYPKARLNVNILILHF